MRWVAILLSVSFLLPPACARAEEISLTLDQALAIALRDNRDILLRSEDVQRAKAKISESKAAFLPALTFTGGWADTRGYFGKDLSQTTTQATLKEYLYKGGKTVNTIAQHTYKLKASEAALERTRLEVGLGVLKAFYTLLLSNELSTVNKDILRNTQEHLAFVKERFSNGQASESDVLHIEASLASVRQAYESSLNQAEAAGALLAQLLYLEKDVRIRPEAEFTYEPREVAYDQAFLKALERRPEIRQYEAQVQADRKAVEVAKADARPSVYASWDYYSRSHAALGTSRGWNDYNVIGLTFSWPVFDGWATQQKVEQALIDLRQSQLSKEKAAKDIALELKQAYLQLKDALAKISSAEAQVKTYADYLVATREQYNKGIASPLDTSDAAIQYAIALFNKKQAVYDYIIAKGSFEKATGGL